MRSMREVRVYSDQPLSADTTLQLGDTAARHVSQVLRMKPGQTLTLFDGSGGEYPASIASVARAAVEVTTGALQTTDRESPLADYPVARPLPRRADGHSGPESH